MIFSYIKEHYNQLNLKIDNKSWIEEKNSGYGEAKTIYKKKKADTLVLKEKKEKKDIVLSNYNFENLRHLQNYFPNAIIDFHIQNNEREIFSPYKKTHKKKEYIETIKIEDRKNNILTKMGYTFIPDKIDYKQLKEDFLRVLDRNKRAIDIISGEYELFFRKRAAGILIHELIGHLLEADISLQANTPFKKENINKRILPEYITIYDDILPSDSIDDEGIIMESITLIKNGVLKNFISDYTHYLAGFNSNGRGRKENYKSPILPRQNIISLKHGIKDEDEIIKGINTGILIDDINSGELNYDTLEITLYIKESFYISKGDKSTPIKPFSIKMSVFDIIQKLTEISNKIYIGGWEGFCHKKGQLIRNGYKIPSYVISNIKF
jgi:predicted Zn-dependent protease